MKNSSLLKNWKEKTLFMKAISILGIIISISIIVLAILQLTNTMKNADNVFMPLLAVLMIIQAIQNWKEQRMLSIFSILVFIYILIVAVLKFIR